MFVKGTLNATGSQITVEAVAAEAEHLGTAPGVVLAVWDGQIHGGRRREPVPGDVCGTYRDGDTLYACPPLASGS